MAGGQRQSRAGGRPALLRPVYHQAACHGERGKAPQAIHQRVQPGCGPIAHAFVRGREPPVPPAAEQCAFAHVVPSIS